MTMPMRVLKETPRLAKRSIRSLLFMPMAWFTQTVVPTDIAELKVRQNMASWFPMLTELTVRFLKNGGKLLAMKGRQYDPVSERFAEAAAALGCHVERTEEYTLEGEPKRLIIVRKDTETPEMYPRRFAKMKRMPL